MRWTILGPLGRLVAAATVVLCATQTRSAASEPLRKWLEPSDEVVTPHIKWRKPAADGPLKVLFITHQIGMREVVEICQRFQITRQVFAVWQPDRFAPRWVYQYRHFPGLRTKELQKRLREKLGGKYDVLVIGGVRWTTLPQWARDEILKKVAAGTGLVGYFPEGSGAFRSQAEPRNLPSAPPSILPAYPFQGLPAFRGHRTREDFDEATLEAATVGAGRVVLLKGYKNTGRGPLTPGVLEPFPNYWPVRYDYYQALLGHVLAWAAHREPNLRVAAPNGGTGRVDRAELVRVEFAVENRTPGTADVELQCVVRHAKWGTVRLRRRISRSLKPGRQVVGFELPKLPAGPYFADLWIFRDRKVVDYGSRYIEVTSPTRIADISLAGRSFRSSPLISIGGDEPTNVLIQVEGIEDLGLSLEVRQFDNYGRLVAMAEPHQFDPDWPEQKRQFKLRPNGILSVVQRLDVRLKAGDELLDHQRRTFFYEDVPHPLDDVRAVMCHGWIRQAACFLSYALGQTMRRAGFDTINVHTRNVNATETETLLPGRAFVLAGCDLIIGTSGIGRIDRLVDGKRVRSQWGAVRVPCLTNPQERRSMQKGARMAAQDWKPFSAAWFNIGDEKQLVAHGLDDDLCFSETCVADFRKWLAAQYPSLDALNGEYGTAFASWDQVVPIDLETARKTGATARWIDHRRHMEGVWARHLTDARDTIRKTIPSATTGTMGSNDAGHCPKTPALGGLDYWKLVRPTSPNLNYYYPLQLDAARDFSGRRRALIGGGLWGGYEQLWRGGTDPRHHRWWIWNGLLRGANAITVYKGAGGESPLSCSTIAPDFSFFDWMGATLEEIRRIKRGPGALLLAADRADDQIGVVYSATSMDLTTFFPDFPQYWDIPAAMPVVFQEAGFQYRLISTEQIEQGLLARKGMRALYLPYVQALSAAAVQKILEFAEKGAAVIADLRPAVADEHGKLLPGGALDKLFGVRQNVADPRPAKRKLELTWSHSPKTLPKTHTDESLRLAGGRALGRAGTAPAVIVNHYGQGTGVLLNMSFSDYMHPRMDYHFTYATEALDRAGSEFFRRVMRLAELKPEVPIEPQLPGCHVTRFRSGQALYLGLLWDAPAFLPVPYHDDPAKYGKLIERREPVKLTLPRRMHIYDVLAGKYLGYAGRISRRVSPGIVHLLAALPYRVAGLSVAPALKTFRPGEVLKFRISVKTDGGPAGLHVFHVELIDPQAAVVAAYCRNIAAKQGVLELEIPSALNEAAGSWQIVATDVASGQVGQAGFSIGSAD